MSPVIMITETLGTWPTYTVTLFDNQTEIVLMEEFKVESSDEAGKFKHYHCKSIARALKLADGLNIRHTRIFMQVNW